MDDCFLLLLRNETLFRVAAPCGFFTACASRFQIAFIENSRLVDDCFIVFVFKLRSGVLDVCLCSRKTCDRHSER